MKFDLIKLISANKICTNSAVFYCLLRENVWNVYRTLCGQLNTHQLTTVIFSTLGNHFGIKKCFWIYPPRKRCFIFSSKYCKIWSAAQCSVSTLHHYWTAEPSFYHQLFRGKIYSECKALNSERIWELFRD